MDRREVLTGGALLAAAAMAGTVFAADEHAHHHHAVAMPTAKLATSAADCLQTGQLCIDHCLVLLGDGDKVMAACAQSVSQMLAVCGALQRIANANSKYLPQMAKLAQDVCRDCAAECKKHADKHAECKNCMDSCNACADECKKFAA
jgi:Cys-rich four helix bundle protein (predicted Tat secretion target)